jgi:hydrogenase expression/formation protein HypC
MCLAVPVKVLEIISPTQIKVDLHGATAIISGVLLPEIKVGDFVLTHAGHAIDKISPEDAQALENTYQELWQALNE